MNWYYAEQGAQKGPVEDREFLQLVAAGRVTDQTLVWHEGLPEWQPFSKVTDKPAAPGVPPSAPAPASAACSRCGRTFEAAQLLRYGEQNVCGECKSAFFQSLQEGVVQPGSQVYGGFWIRFAAKFLDGIILSVVNTVLKFGVLFVLFGQMAAATPSNPAHIFATLAVTYSVGIVVGISYIAGFVGRFGATPGKMACGLKIICADGGRVSYGRAVGRYFAEVLSSLTLLIGYLMVIGDAEKRALHDRICGTRVIRTR